MFQFNPWQEARSQENSLKKMTHMLWSYSSTTLLGSLGLRSFMSTALPGGGDCREDGAYRSNRHDLERIKTTLGLTTQPIPP